MTLLNSNLSRFLFTIIGLGLLPIASAAQQYSIEVNLNSVEKNRLTVICNTPPVQSDQTRFFMPAIVPGTYSIYDFGSYVSELKAYSQSGQALEVMRETINSWQIKNSTVLSKIIYTVEATWTKVDKNIVFEPAGTSFQKNKVYVLNPHAMFGYLEDSKDHPYQLTFHKPLGFYGSTALSLVQSDSVKDIFEAKNYMELADSPLLYCIPDTTTLLVGGTQVLVSVYCPNSFIKSGFIAEEISTLLRVQKEYLGGKLPIPRYSFLFYFTDQTPKSGLVGALEHSYSSLYYLIESLPNSELVQSIKDIAAHEFFHILTPLTIHSEEIHNFDFISPKMSKHLWLYEGTTEYAATHMQVKYGLISQDEYFKILANKIQNSAAYQKNLSFTEMSQHCLEKHKSQYGNVYEKGALIAACLDILMLENSNGSYGLQKLMQELSQFYGKNKPFKDDELFEKIVEISNQPSIRSFFSDYVEGTKELPYETFFAKVGIEYAPLKTIRILNIGKIEIRNSEKGLKITKIYSDKTTKKIGYQLEDHIIEINKMPVDKNNMFQLLEYDNRPKNTITVFRNGEKVVLALPRKPTMRLVKNYISLSPKTLPAQNKLRDQWLTIKQD